MAGALRLDVVAEAREHSERALLGIGYDAEEAFSRAFKRAHGESPSVWRAGYMLR